jgi:hypothetical protein
MKKGRIVVDAAFLADSFSSHTACCGGLSSLMICKVTSCGGFSSLMICKVIFRGFAFVDLISIMALSFGHRFTGNRAVVRVFVVWDAAAIATSA